MIALQCPVCARVIHVRAGSATCAHGATVHDAKRPKPMVRIPSEQEVA